jgi:preprotein translocase subunit SecA
LHSCRTTSLGKTVYFQEKIREARADKDAKIADYLNEVEKVQDIDAREDIYASIDALEKEAYEISEKPYGTAS